MEKNRTPDHIAAHHECCTSMHPQPSPRLASHLPLLCVDYLWVQGCPKSIQGTSQNTGGRLPACFPLEKAPAMLIILIKEGTREVAQLMKCRPLQHEDLSLNHRAMYKSWVGGACLFLAS